VRGRIESQLGISATDNYRVSEVMGPGISGECEEHKDGLHINEDHFLCEVIDPVSGEVLPPGEMGELVITTLTKEALPIIRYRTRDLTSLNPEPCACGRTMARMARVSSRTDDVVIVEGVKLFPAQIEAALLGVEGVEPHYQVLVDRLGATDRIEVQVEVSGGLLTGDVRHLLRTQNQLRQKLENAIGLPTEVKLVEPRTLERARAPRIVDRRKDENRYPARPDPGSG
jgi:phenylacetate-CoA ligase